MTSLETLRANVSALSAKDQSFAFSLLSQAARGKPLSDKQLFWVDKLAKRATGDEPAAPERVTEAVGDLGAVIAMFDKAKEHLKKPTIVLGFGELAGRSIRLSLATSAARVPGSINVVDEQSRVWYGRILRDGRFEHTPRDPVPAGLGDTLSEFAKDPAGVAAHHGHLTGKCCFCNTTLTDERSTAVGYGPVCAKRFGLAWGSKH